MNCQTTHVADVQECHVESWLTGQPISLELRVSAAPFFFEGEELTVCSLRDITDEKRRQVLERLFFHDILNSAGALKAMVEMKDQVQCDEEDSLTETVRNLSSQIVEEIQSHRDLVAAEAGELAVKILDVHVPELLEKVCSLYRRHSLGSDKQIVLAPLAAQPVIWTDEVLLGRILGNLIKNALEASEPGDTVTVAFENTRQPCFSVHNPAVMPESVQFQMFQRSFSTRQERGRGIGSYSVKLLTEKYLRGKVWFDSRPPHGTTFFVSLPSPSEEVLSQAFVYQLSVARHGRPESPRSVATEPHVLTRNPRYSEDHSARCARDGPGCRVVPKGVRGHGDSRLRSSARVPEAERVRGRMPGRTGDDLLVQGRRARLPGRATRPAVLRRRVGRDRDRGRIDRRAEDDRRPRPARVHGRRLAADRPPRRHLGLRPGRDPGLLRQPGRAAPGHPGDPRPQRQAARGVPDAPDHAGAVGVRRRSRLRPPRRPGPDGDPRVLRQEQGAAHLGRRRRRRTARPPWRRWGSPRINCRSSPATGARARRGPTVTRLAECLGLKRQIRTEPFDLVIVGAGPAGLAAAVYGASEGLSTLVLDRFGPGGQAGTSSRIENYMGFPAGLTGADLANRGYLQALKFGAELVAPVEVRSMTCEDKMHRLDPRRRAGRPRPDGPDRDRRHLSAASRSPAASAGTARGSYYSCTSVHARSCKDGRAAVVGGGNSAGQAAMFLADHTAGATLLLRGGDIRKSMSDYLARRIEQHDEDRGHPPRRGGRRRGRRHARRACGSATSGTGGTRDLDCSAVFVFIGAQPRTDWLPPSIAVDAKGFILTGADAAQSDRWPLTDREPCTVETTCPGVFAAGDVRSNTTKRVAFAVGDGALAVTCAHRVLSEL